MYTEDVVEALLQIKVGRVNSCSKSMHKRRASTLAMERKKNNTTKNRCGLWDFFRAKRAGRLKPENAMHAPTWHSALDYVIGRQAD